MAGWSYAADLRVGYFKLVPHAYPGQEKRAQGPMIEYFSQIAEKMGITEVAYIEAPLSRLMKLLEQGRIDALLYMAKNPEREKRFQYPKTPFVTIRPALAVRADNPLRAVTSASDLESFTIGARADISYLPAVLQNEHIQIDPLYGSGDVLERNLKKLASKRLDAVFESGLRTLRFWVKHLGFEPDIRVMPLPGAPLELYTIFSENSPREKLSLYEKTLKAFLKTRSYNEIFETYYQESPEMLEWLKK